MPRLFSHCGNVAMKMFAAILAANFILSFGTLHAFDEDFWINTTESVERDLRYVANIAANDETLFAATGAGLWRSNNSGASWKHVPISDFGIIAGVNILGDGVILVGGRDSLHFSTDKGEDWTTISHLRHGIPQIDYYRFVERPDGTLFVAMRDWYSGQFVADGIWQSTDRGNSWSLVCDNLINGAKSTCIALHPNGDVFWGSWDWEGLFVLRAESGECHNIYAPGGLGEFNWDPLSMAINSRGTILVGTNETETSVFRSRDAGKNWVFFNGWPANYPRGNILAMIVDRYDNFICSAAGTIWYSSDEGDSWTNLYPNNPAFGFYSLCVDSLGYLYGGTNKGDIYRTKESIYTATGLNTSEPTDSEFNFSLSPNPTTGDLTLDFTLETQGLVTAELFDMRGAMVKQVFSRQYSAGSHRTTNKMDLVVAGVYVLRLSVGAEVLNRLITVVR